jgi:hypothetical protein
LHRAGAAGETLKVFQVDQVVHKGDANRRETRHFAKERAVPLSARAVAMLRTLPCRRCRVMDRMNGMTATATQPAGPPFMWKLMPLPNPPAGGRASATFQQSHEVNNDSLFKKPWKQGPFDSTFTNQRRGRDSNFQENLGENKGLTEGWHRIRHSFHENRFRG